MKRRMLLLAEMDEPTQAELENDFDIVRFGRAAGEPNAYIDEDAVLGLVEDSRPEVAVVELEPMTDRVVTAAAPDLRLIACSRATPTNIDLAACARDEVMVTNAPGRNANAVVEMTLGLILCLARFIPQTHHEIKCRRLTLPPGTPVDRKDVLWQHVDLVQNPYRLYRGIEVEGRRLGLVGFGIISRMLSPKAAGLGMEIVSYDPFVAAGEMATYGVAKMETLDALLSTADFVSVHAKPTPATIGMIGAAQFAKMKPGAFFINTSRGALVDQGALVQALRERRIAGAALDVYDYEPQYHDSPLLDLDNLVMTPHIGGATKDVTRHQSRILKANIAAYLSGDAPPNLVLRKP